MDAKALKISGICLMIILYKGLIDIRYLLNEIAFNEDYYVENIKSEFKELSNNLVKAHAKDISYLVGLY